MGLKPTCYWLELEGFPEKGTLVVGLRGWVVLRQTERGVIPDLGKGVG